MIGRSQLFSSGFWNLSSLSHQIGHILRAVSVRKSYLAVRTIVDASQLGELDTADSVLRLSLESSPSLGISTWLSLALFSIDLGNQDSVLRCFTFFGFVRLDVETGLAQNESLVCHWPDRLSLQPYYECSVGKQGSQGEQGSHA